MDKILGYLGQQSTWKGIVAVAGAVGISISPELATEIIAAVIGIVGAINVIRNEKKAEG